MPVTFLAHQAPVLPIARRWPGRTDGVALVVGSMAPDFAYVLNGSRFDVSAHGLPELVLFCVPVTFVVAWLIVRLLAPRRSCVLPELGGFHLRDFRGLAIHQPRVLATAGCAVVGALSHVALDHLTHDWGWAAHNIDWYREPIVERDLFGRRWTPYRLAQYSGHLVLSALAVWWSWGQWHEAFAGLLVGAASVRLLSAVDRSSAEVP